MIKYKVKSVKGQLVILPKENPTVGLSPRGRGRIT